ncbi:DJ-1/PfpI family protein [Pectobacterium wasabiae]|uniref:DJ-1/PfpI family protein n=1 Tax=Pectobacterium wasabiae TaxID=55208 RepID=UPI00027B0646|nr:DJ-1/PfpI family protein [Pectobacterium wasabiae]AOR65725.1 hypothetical protein A7983_21155 [Pectobacterium wasabiae CFBP 3304]EJS96672.1 Cyclohexyl-isocyanide hydratase [Pectobacterium wasabiae CFBP 3304]
MLIQSIMYPDFTTLDLIGAQQTLSMLPNARIECVAAEAGPVMTDAGVALIADKSFKTASRSPDIILVPGGRASSIDVLEDSTMVDFVARQGADATWVCSVCSGALLLGMAGLLEGYRAASHWSVIDTLAAFGAIPTHQRVVIDRNRATGGGVTAGVDFGLTLAGVIAGEDYARILELVIEYNPQPPFGTGHPTLADTKTMEIARPIIEDGVSTARIWELAKTRRGAA